MADNGKGGRRAEDRQRRNVLLSVYVLRFVNALCNIGLGIVILSISVTIDDSMTGQKKN